MWYLRAALPLCEDLQFVHSKLFFWWTLSLCAFKWNKYPVLKSHRSQENTLPLWMTSLCIFRLSFLPKGFWHWSQSNISCSSECLALLWFSNLSFLTVLKVHKSQLNFDPCTRVSCISSLFFVAKLFLHWEHVWDELITSLPRISVIFLDTTNYSLALSIGFWL